MNKKTKTLILSVTALATLATIAGCASMALSDAEVDAGVQAALKSSFTDKGQAKVDRLQQDALQQACSSDKMPTAEVSAKLEAEQLATVKWPAGDPGSAAWLGNWKEGEKLAQNGRGATWSDPVDSKNGGNCYNCHQITKAEISYGTIGPSLYHYGKLRGVNDPAAPASQAIVKYTWGKLYNAKAYNACSGMPRFGHEKLLDDGQIRDLMALLLDPKSPVNAD